MEGYSKMSRLTPVQGLLMNLNQEIEPGRREYLSKEQAYKRLKELTGQDLGYDVEKWGKWFKSNPNPLIRPKKREYSAQCGRNDKISKFRNKKYGLK
jgi:hypothetical protein